MKRRRIIIFLIFALLAGGTAYYFFSKNKKEAYLWRTAKVEKGDVIVAVTATGSINADTTVQVGTQVSGIIAKLFADFNTVVKKGEIVAMLDTTLLNATKEDVLANLERAEVQVRQSKLEFDRNKKLFDEKVISQADYDLASTNFNVAKSALKSSKAQLNHAKINIRYATIRAPVSGTVISRSVDVGQTVIANFNSPTLFTIANDLTKMQVHANIDEADIGQVKRGQKVSFTVDAYPDKVFQGLVKQIRLQPVVVQNVVTYIVIIDVPNPDLKLMPGLTANITIKVQEHKGVLKIPGNALHFTPPDEYFKTTHIPDSVAKQWNEVIKLIKKERVNQTDTSAIAYIWILKDRSIYPKKVKKGISDETFVEVSGDIKKEEEVVIGISSKEGESAAPVQNPFMPKFPSRKTK
ncbi:MAG: efflux RND transporter periplasmic adaptor subunit [Bacteroidota bacterium]